MLAQRKDVTVDSKCVCADYSLGKMSCLRHFSIFLVIQGPTDISPIEGSIEGLAGLTARIDKILKIHTCSGFHRFSHLLISIFENLNHRLILL